MEQTGHPQSSLFLLLHVLSLLLPALQAAPISLRSAKAAINQGLETNLTSGMKVEEQQYAKVTKKFGPLGLLGPLGLATVNMTG